MKTYHLDRFQLRITYGQRPCNLLGCRCVRQLSRPGSHDLDSGGNNSCAIRDNGEGQIDCWGQLNGILDVPDGEYRQVSVGDRAACAIKTGSTLVCWGRGQANEANQFGQAVPGGFYSKVSVGSHRACAMRQGDGAIDCWGATV